MNNLHLSAQYHEIYIDNIFNGGDFYTFDPETRDTNRHKNILGDRWTDIAMSREGRLYSLSYDNVGASGDSTFIFELDDNRGFRYISAFPHLESTGMTIDHRGRIFGSGQIFLSYSGPTDQFEPIDQCVFHYDTLSRQGTMYAKVIPAAFYLAHPGVYINDISFYDGDLYAVGSYYRESNGMQGCLFKVDTSNSAEHEILFYGEFFGSVSLATVADSCGSQFMMSESAGQFWYFKPDRDSVWRHESFGIGASGATSKSSHLGSIPGLRIVDVQLDYTDCEDNHPDVIVQIREGRPPAVRYSIDGRNFQTSPLFSDVAPGSYQVTIEDDWGCSDMSDLFSIVEHSALIDSAYHLTASCADDAILLELQAIDTLIEFSIDGVQFFAQDSSLQLSVARDTTLYFRYRDSCITTRQLDIPQIALPILDSVQVQRTYCDQSTGSVQAFSSTTGPRYFRLGNGQESTTGRFDSLSAGSYRLYLVDSIHLCQDSMDFEIIEVDAPQIDSVQTTAVHCNLSDGSARAYWSSVDPIYFTLGDGRTSTSGEFYDLDAGSYKIYIIDSLSQCMDSMSFVLMDAAIPMIDSMTISPDTCGQQTGTLRVVDVSSQSPVMYSIDGSTYQADSLFSDLGAGDYEVSIRDSFGCISDYSVSVPLYHLTPSFSLDFLYAEDCRDAAARIIITSSESDLLVLLDARLIELPYDNPIEDGEHILSVSSVESCTVDSLFTVVAQQPQNCGYFMPNVFSPNADGINDSYRAYGDASTISYDLAIYDRWGAEVYRETGTDAIMMLGWNGEYKGSQAPIGVYVYRFSYFRSDTEMMEVIAGDMTLVR